MVERMNTTIRNMLSKYIKENLKNWDLHLDCCDGIKYTKIKVSISYQNPEKKMNFSISVNLPFLAHLDRRLTR